MTRGAAIPKTVMLHFPFRAGKRGGRKEMRLPEGTAAASKAVRTIREGMWVVAEQPEAGRPVDRMGPALWEWLIGCGEGGYVVLYRPEGDLAVVLAVRHQREAGYG